MNSAFYSKKSLYLFMAVILVFIISSIFIFQDMKAQTTKQAEAKDTKEVLTDLEDKYSLITDQESDELESEDIKEDKNIEIAINEKKDNKAEINMNSNLEPIKDERYIVNRGDTLYLIARRANISIDELKNINNLYREDEIYEGQVIQTKGSNSANPVDSGNNNSNSKEDDIYWLSRIIHAEAQGESYTGKVAVGNVVLNRVASKDYPNTIRGVIYDKQHGYVQFSPVLDGSINNKPNEESTKAAIDALNGVRPVGGALYFLNPDKATNFWIVSNREYYMTIGDHDFYH